MLFLLVHVERSAWLLVIAYEQGGRVGLDGTPLGPGLTLYQYSILIYTGSTPPLSSSVGQARPPPPPWIGAPLSQFRHFELVPPLDRSTPLAVSALLQHMRPYGIHMGPYGTHIGAYGI